MKIHIKPIKIALIALLITSAGLAAFAQNINNPVLPGVADAGVLKYNGKYYIGGVFTNGDYYTSKDLVNWEGPVHVFSMDNEWTKGTGAGDNQIHANDMMYINGVFHLYWSVNYWGKDRHAVHIGHAISDNVLGPYHEPIKDTWIDNRIDPKVFQDDDGKLYMYMVRFTDGNTIWVRPVKEDGSTFSGPPIYQFASLPDTWETMDNRVAEGPWVLKYRNRYYMMYNANHTGTAWGNYQLGVAEADAPTLFNHGNKYPYPLLQSNQTAIEENYTDLLLFQDDAYNPFFSYTTGEPAKDWKKRSYENVWEKGRGGFASGEIEGSTVRKYGTNWNSDKLYLQKVFKANRKPGNLALRILHDGDTRVFLNGQMIYDKQGADYTILPVDYQMKDLLSEKENLLAIETRKGNRGNYINLSLFDMRDETADEILFSPGQPNILRGPNGFEWWLIYMANKNNERRGQYINRIHFFDKTMYSDGVTSKHTKGYFPEPAKPTCSTMDFPDNTSKYTLIDKQYSGTAYLFEAGIHTSSEAGVIAWWKDTSNWIRIGLKEESNEWYKQTCINGKISRKSYPLANGFRFGVYHTIRIERNITSFHIKIDDLPAPGESWFTVTEAYEKGMPGLFSEQGNNAYDGITYTLGWDEFDTHITHWGNYTASQEGLRCPDNQKSEAFKGDFLPQYEFSLQVRNKTKAGLAGAYPVYIDKNNYIRATFNYDTQKLDVSAVVKGSVVYKESHSLENLKTHYADMKYTDFIEKGYSFHSPTVINQIQVSRRSADNDTLFIDNMFNRLSAEYLSEGKWYPLPTEQAAVASNPLYNELSFRPVTAEGVRFINKDATDLSRYVYKIRINEVSKESYNLRCVKRNKDVLILVDGKLICTINQAYPAAQVGLYSERCTPAYNGILRYHIPN